MAAVYQCSAESDDALVALPVGKSKYTAVITDVIVPVALAVDI